MLIMMVVLIFGICFACHLFRIYLPPLRVLPSARQHPSYGDCLEVKRNIIRTAPCSVV